MRALVELDGVRSPLLEAGLTKAEIRTLSRERGLFTWNKPAKACLASRVADRKSVVDRIGGLQKKGKLLPPRLDACQVPMGSDPKLRIRRQDPGQEAFRGLDPREPLQMI